MSTTRFHLLFAIAAVAVVSIAVAEASAPAGRYTTAGGTVTDTKTKLTWQQTAPADTYTFPVAQAYCRAIGATLGGTGWRLPTIKELQTIVDDSRSNPAIDPIAFPAAPSTTFFSASPIADAEYLAWTVSFGYGDTSYGSKTDTYSVRCVR